VYKPSVVMDGVDLTNEAGEVQGAIERLRAKQSDAQLPSALEQVVQSATSLFAVTGSGIMFADDEHELHYVAASDGHGRHLEKLQAHTGRGPCVDALLLDTVIQTRDVTADERWRVLHDELSGTPVRAVVGIPVHLAGAAVGSLDAYHDGPHDWTEDEVRGMKAYAGLVESLLATALRAERHERLATQLQHALDHRVAIERAVGMVMARRGLEAVDAFNVIRNTARSSRRRVVDVAEELLGGGDLPGEDPS
jgi:transcriptional regulator with GAF, ATPase, and Fis domain